jgi:hypothetical protein
MIWPILNAIFSLELRPTQETGEKVNRLVNQFLQNAAAGLHNDNEERSEGSLKNEPPFGGLRNPFFGRLIAFCKRHPNAIPRELGPVVQKAVRIQTVSFLDKVNQEFMKKHFPNWDATSGTTLTVFGPEFDSVLRLAGIQST